MNQKFLVGIAIAAAFAAAAAPGEAEAQYGTRIGSFNVTMHMDETSGRDRQFAIVFPQGQTRDGALMWSCGDDPTRFVAAVRLREEGTDGFVRRVAWSLDGGAPDTAMLRGTSGSRAWLVDDAQADGFTRRVRAAERMRLTVLGGPGGAEAYEYVLARTDSALLSLECARDAEIPGTPSGREALLAQSSDPFLRADGKLESAPFPDEWMPRLLNLTEVVRAMERSYPPALRDSLIQGDVDLRIRVLRDGTVDLPAVRVTLATHPGFVPAALRTLASMRFQPARRRGEVVDVWVTLPIRFMTEQ